MTQDECDEYWEDCYTSHRAYGRSVDTAKKLADEELENWLERQH